MIQLIKFLIRKIWHKVNKLWLIFLLHKNSKNKLSINLNKIHKCKINNKKIKRKRVFNNKNLNLNQKDYFLIL